MRPVNLLPERERPRRQGGERPGIAYLVVGVLGLLLAAAVVYVVTLNGIDSKRAEAAQATREAEEAEARAGELAAFGSFSAIKQVRVSSVKMLAASRFDWERLVRELARLLPEGVWVTELDASLAPGKSESGAGGGASAAGSSEEPEGPALKVTGCALRQHDVATTLVRLRRLHRAADVTLSESAKPDAKGSSGAAAAAGSDDCDSGYKFTATVELSPAPAPADTGTDRNIPATLGGGP